MTIVKAWCFWMVATLLCLALMPVFAIATRWSRHLSPQARRAALGLPVR